MAFVLAGASGNYLDLLDDLETFCNLNGWTTLAASQEAVSAVVAAGGTGYSIADQLTLVDEFSAAFAGDSVFNVDNVAAESADSIAAGGSGYVNGAQTLTLVGGTFSTAATVDVNVVGGVVDSITSLNVPGDYTVVPGNPVATSGGGGTGATLNMTFGVVLGVSLVTSGGYHYFPSNPAATTGNGTGCTLTVTTTNTDSTKAGKRLILRGDGSGAEEIFVGMAADDLGGGSVHWNLRGFTGFQANVDFNLQPGLFTGLAFVPLNNGATTHWFFVNPSRIIMVARMSTSYMNMYLGFINRFGTSVDFPYPLLVAGCSTSGAIFSDNLAGFSGMNDPNYHTTAGTPTGPAVLRTPGGAWIPFANAAGAFSFRSARQDAVITPPGKVTLSTSANTWDDFIPLTNTSPIFAYRQTPDSAASTGFRFPLIPCILMENSPQLAIHGEMDNVYWAGTLTELSGQASAEDVYNVNGDDYILFPNCNRTDHWANFLIKKE